MFDWVVNAPLVGFLFCNNRRSFSKYFYIKNFKLDDFSGIKKTIHKLLETNLKPQKKLKERIHCEMFLSEHFMKYHFKDISVKINHLQDLS